VVNFLFQFYVNCFKKYYTQDARVLNKDQGTTINGSINDPLIEKEVKDEKMDSVKSPEELKLSWLDKQESVNLRR